MSIEQPSGQQLPDPQEFIDSYGPDAPVSFGEGSEMTLAQALELEAMFCEASDASRTNTVKRLGFLAQKLHAAGTLRPEDEYLTQLRSAD